MLYFDSVSRLQLPPWRQLAWTILHFPLHLALTLFTEGCAQFIIFWKISEIEWATIWRWEAVMLEAISENTTDFSQPIRVWLDDFFETKPPHFLFYRWTLNDTLDELAEFSGPPLDDYREAHLSGNLTRINQTINADPVIRRATDNWGAVLFLVINVANSELGLDYYEDELLYQGIAGSDSSLAVGTMETEEGVSWRSWYRMRVVFQYTYVCGGAVIGLLAILAIIGRTEKWTRWAVTRTVIALVIGVATALVATISKIGGNVPLAKYLLTPLVLPPFAILFLLLLVLHHLPEGPLSRCLSVRRWKKSKRSEGSSDEQRREGQDGGHGQESGRDVELANATGGQEEKMTPENSRDRLLRGSIASTGQGSRPG